MKLHWCQGAAHCLTINFCHLSFSQKEILLFGGMTHFIFLFCYSVLNYVVFLWHLRQITTHSGSRQMERLPCISACQKIQEIRYLKLGKQKLKWQSCDPRNCPVQRLAELAPRFRIPKQEFSCCHEMTIIDSFPQLLEFL